MQRKIHKLLYCLTFICMFVPVISPLRNAAGQKILQKPVFEPENPHKPGNIAAEKWVQIPPGLQGSFASVDRRYESNTVPLNACINEWSISAWRGERVHTQILLWSATGIRQARFKISGLKNGSGAVIDKENISVKIIRYVLSDRDYRSVRKEPPALFADVLDDAERFGIDARFTRPVWLKIDIPPEAVPGRYTGTISVESENSVAVPFSITVDVLPLVLPAPADWSFHLDLWQAPWSVAGYHHVEPWSEEHWKLLRPLIKMLADAGQKCITTSIVHEPWAHQTYHEVGSMIEWIKTASGGWKFDYSVFDKYVRFCMRCGIKKQINCYSMAPWSNSFRYFDEKLGNYLYIYTVAGSDEFKNHWRPFLQDFVRHLKKMGWLGITSIAMDERPLDVMENIIAFVKEISPELKITLAGNYHPELKYDILDYCVYITPPLAKERIAERVAKGLPTTFYVCTVPEKPNTFPFSLPAESAWQGWYAAACGYSGFLRWAYNSWVHDPLRDTRFITWPGGDCFLVYPGARSSIRFERLREGIQDYEMIRIVRNRLKKDTSSEAKKLLNGLNEALEEFTYENAQNEPCKNAVNAGKAALLNASLYLAEKAR